MLDCFEKNLGCMLYVVCCMLYVVVVVVVDEGMGFESDCML